MAEADNSTTFPAVYTHGGQFVQYNVFQNLFEVPAKYHPPIDPIGNGSIVTAISALNSETKEMVALKKIENAFDNIYTGVKCILREIKILRHFDHENIIGLRDVVVPPLGAGSSDVYIGTQLMDTNLDLIITSSQSLSEEHYQYFLYQILRGLKYIHSSNVIHGGLKPSNLLINENCDLKISYFSLAGPTIIENEYMSEYEVNSRYRAPELLFNSYNYYTSAIDMWSLGCIYMELMNRKPLLPGKDYIHQIRLLLELLGTPIEAELGFLHNEAAIQYIRQLPPQPRQQLRQVFPQVDPLAIDLVEKMLTFDPTQRITVEEALSHSYLAKFHDITDEPVCHEPFSFDFENQALDEEQMKEMIYQEALALNPCYA